MDYNVVSLFSGAMGLDLGLEQAGLKIRVCVEIDQACKRTALENKPDLPFLDKDITTLSGADILRFAGLQKEDVSVIAGGPPCQAFSVIGKRKGLEDERGKLIFDFLRIVKDVRPKVFLMENVRGLLSMKLTELSPKGSLLNQLVADFEEIGYRVDAFVVNAVNYGAPQIRERLVLIGNRYNLVANFPTPTHSDQPIGSQKPFVTLGDAIRVFKDHDPTIMDFSERKKKYLAMVPPGGNWRSLPVEIQKESMEKTWYLKGGRSAYWRRLAYDYPSPTVVTMPNHAGTSMCHPEETRALTVGECSAIQGFPKSWKFVGTPSEKYRQVGNAVPTVLGQVFGMLIVDLINTINRGDYDLSGQPIKSKVIHVRPHVRTRQYWKNGKVFLDEPYLNNQERLGVIQLKLSL